MIFRKALRGAPALIYCLSSLANAGENGVGIVGGGGSGKLIQMERYRAKRGDFKIEISSYDLEPKPLLFFERGTYLGFEVSDFTFRPYFGASELLVGIATKKYPVFYFGTSAGVLYDLSQYKPFYSDLGIEGSLWLGTVLGTFKITERLMIQEYYQTRFDYLVKIPVIGG